MVSGPRRPAEGGTAEAEEVIGNLYPFCDNDPVTMSILPGNARGRRSNGGPDSRLKHASEQYFQAKKSCTWVPDGKDDSKEAAKCLGRALHPLQDWVAHGDFNRRREAPYISSVPWHDKLQYAHNKLTKQKGRSWESVDDPTLDSTGPNGRATMAVLQFAQITTYGDRLYWARFDSGTQRIRLAETKTKEMFKQFMDHVRTKAKPCGECQKEFLETP